MILEGTILLGISHGCQFRGRLIQYLKNDCALLENCDGERHIVYDYYAAYRGVTPPNIINSTKF